MLRDEVRKAVRWGAYELHEHPMIKFFLVFTLLFVYFVFASMKFGADKGLVVSMLTWSFFVLCTPVADAGILIDLPLRLLTGIRMVYSEVLVWMLAIAMNVSAFFMSPGIYDDTLFLGLFAHIVTQPFPYWGIILLSALGTFMSVLFGDELVDIATERKERRHHHRRHRAKHKLLVFIFLIVLIVILYDFLLHNLGVSIPLF